MKDLWSSDLWSSWFLSSSTSIPCKCSKSEEKGASEDHLSFQTIKIAQESDGNCGQTVDTPPKSWHCKSQNRIKAGPRNPLTNSSLPLTKGTQNVTTKTELGRQVAFGGIHLFDFVAGSFFFRHVKYSNTKWNEMKKWWKSDLLSFEGTSKVKWRDLNFCAVCNECYPMHVCIAWIFQSCLLKASMVASFFAMLIALMTFSIFGWVRISIVEAGASTSILSSSWAGADHSALVESPPPSHVCWAQSQMGSAANFPSLSL